MPKVPTVAIMVDLRMKHEIFMFENAGNESLATPSHPLTALLLLPPREI
jgi:hypothetical protein